MKSGASVSKNFHNSELTMTLFSYNQLNPILFQLKLYFWQLKHFSL